MPTLEEIVQRVNDAVGGRPFGQLQPLRKQLRNLSRMPTAVPFDYPKDPNWTFHAGGRDELQFNLGFEEPIDEHDFRFGVAFSFELSMTLPNLGPLEPKVRLFNDYMVEHAATFDDLRMWHHGEYGRSLPRRPEPIEADLFVPSVFVFMGGTARSDDIDYQVVADTLDRLLPMWKFIEEGGDAARAGGTEQSQFAVQPRPPSQLASARGSRTGGRFSIALHHNAIANQLYAELVQEYGKDCVGAEQTVPGAGRADMVVDTPDRCIVFEVKTASTARQCVREAIGQLLDYGCGPGGLDASELYVVGEPDLDAGTADYIERLNQRFPVPLGYRTIRLEGLRSVFP